MIRLAINGFGRIGRMVLRALHERDPEGAHVRVVAINDLSKLESNAHLLKYDSVHGPMAAQIRVASGGLCIDDQVIKMYASRDPAQITWSDDAVDVVLECTGAFRTREKAAIHLSSGAKKVLISAPAADAVDATIVYGVNDHTLQAGDVVVSNASCTTNCLSPVAKALNDAFTIESGLMTTIHAYTKDQVLTDSSHSDIRRARSATQSMIPTKTGAAQAVGLVLPELAGKLDGYAVRVPVINVSMLDLTVQTQQKATVAQVNQVLKKASEEQFKGVLAYNEEPLVSIDFNHCSASSVFDATQTRVLGSLIKVVAWYDNEWGFAQRMLDTAIKMAQLKS